MTQIKYKLAISVFVTLFLAGAANITAQDRLSADQVIQKVADKLASVKTLKYLYKRELNYPSTGYLSKVAAESFLDLRPADSELGFKYQFSSEDLLAIYNGSEEFLAEKKNKTMRVENDPPLKFFRGFGFFYLSPLTLKNVLPKIVADKTIQKKVTATMIGGIEHYVLELVFTHESFDPILGDIYVPKTDRKSIYKLTVNKTTLLPVQVFEGNDQNGDFAQTDFLDLKEGAVYPPDLTWYFSTYSKEFTLEKPEDIQLISNGQDAPDFKLASYGSDPRISLSQFKGKVVLLEFWIANCGFCIEAVPKLNVIDREFREKNFEFISINVHDSQKLIDLFRNNNKPEYQIVTDSGSIGSSFGVSAYPSFVLVDKNGKVVYSKAGLDEKELEKDISNIL